MAITPLPGQAGLRVAGEVDITNHEEFRSALAALPADGVASVHLDLSLLGFMDVAGARELVALRLSRPCLRLILHNPPASLRRIIGLLKPAAGIEISDSLADATDPASGLKAGEESWALRH